MNNQSRDELLSALLDGELDDETHLQVEDLLNNRPEAQARLESFASVDNLLRQSLGEINETPLPRIDADTMVRGVSPWMRSVSIPLAAAASVIMLLGGALFGIMAERMTTPAAPAIAQTAPPSNLEFGVSRDELNNALETFASGTTAKLTLAGTSSDAAISIVRTWKLEDGRYCREYDVSSSAENQREVGVACRELSGEWRIRMRTYPDAKGTFL